MFQRQVARAARTLAGQAFESRIPQASRTSYSVAHVSKSRVLGGLRPYSASTEPAKEDGAAAEAKTEAKTEAKDEDPTQKELAAKKQELTEVTDKWKRSIAEYRNLQQQTKREVQAAKDFALQRFAKDLLDSVDNLDRALSVVPQEKLDGSNPELKTLFDGLKMTETVLLNTLKKHGLERFDPAENAEKFDPNKHEATFQTPQPDKQDGTVFFTQSKGFLLNGRVIRPAKVGVVKNS